MLFCTACDYCNATADALQQLLSKCFEQLLQLLPPQGKRRGLGRIVELPASAKMAVFFAPAVSADPLSVAVVSDTPVKHGIVVQEGLAFVNGDCVLPVLAVYSSLPCVHCCHLNANATASCSRAKWYSR